MNRVEKIASPHDRNNSSFALNPLSPRLIFISLVRIDNIDERGIYQDLLREFLSHGYDVTIVCPLERINGLKTRILNYHNLTILQVRTLNVQKCGIIEKGLSILSLNFLFKRAIIKYINNVYFDLIVYTTPPITLVNLFSWLKSKKGSKTYLLLKDIFPQNAVDMGYLKYGGFIHRYFSNFEKKLYQVSDKIGCISEANVDYIFHRFPELKDRLEVNPNSVDFTRLPEMKLSREDIRLKWGIPNNATVYLFGGNLGKPQGTEFLLEIISSCYKYVPGAYFLIVGDGTDYLKLNNWFKINNPTNAQLIKKISKNDFDSLTCSCDVGLILLRKEFTIPNFPSRVLTYLENKLPILAITDIVSDLGTIAVKNNFGKWALYGDLESTLKHIIFYTNEDSIRKLFGNNGYNFMEKNYNSSLSYKLINDFYRG
jgi:glycosyltransferase involved in cell wall biosynthesis